jgi:hypothetical protein
MTDIAERLESIATRISNGSGQTVEISYGDIHDGAQEIRRLRVALTLAEDVLSRAPFSNAIWPNGMHPNKGISVIRSALSPPEFDPIQAAIDADNGGRP